MICGWMINFSLPMNYSQCSRPNAKPFMMFRFLFLFVAFPLLSFAQLAIPEHGGVWVHDEAGVLSAGAKAEIEYILKAERDSTSNQIAVLIIPSLEGEIMEEYAIKVAHEKWKLGQKDKDNGRALEYPFQR